MSTGNRHTHRPTRSSLYSTRGRSNKDPRGGVGCGTQACWNCGRKATETCSGCNTARYCGSFCQHKDWETHHKICGSGAAAGGRKTATTAGPRPSTDTEPGQLEPTKQETSAGDEMEAEASRADGERSSKTSPDVPQVSAEPTKRETPSETE